MRRKISLLLLLWMMALWVNAQTAGTLAVTVTTASYGGTYNPRNVVAIWVQSKSGAFVKTLLAYAAERKIYLSAWKTATGGTYNVVDAITGATRTSHQALTCSWNGQNQTGTVLGDDTYNVVMEMTEGSSNKFGVFAFKKGSTVQTVTPANIIGFSNIKLVWTPASTAVEAVQSDKNAYLYPNPAKDCIIFTAEDFDQVQIFAPDGRLMLTSVSSPVNIASLRSGLYMARVVSHNHIIYKGEFLKL
ncbi:MAG: hypothetical protein RIS29_2828 [Bacteroidota bacterium]